MIKCSIPQSYDSKASPPSPCLLPSFLTRTQKHKVLKTRTLPSSLCVCFCSHVQRCALSHSFSWSKLRIKFPPHPGSNLGHLLCPPPAHLQGLQTGAWSGPRWQRSRCTGGPGCAAPGPLHPSGGGCWTSADLDTQSHSSGAGAAAERPDFTLFPVVLALTPSSLTSLSTTSEKKPLPLLAVKALVFFI